MKKTRLLEIIRDEIKSVLSKASYDYPYSNKTEEEEDMIYNLDLIYTSGGKPSKWNEELLQMFKNMDGNELKKYAKVAAKEPDHITQANYFDFLRSLPNYKEEFTPEDLNEMAYALNEMDTNVPVPINILLKYAGDTSKYEDYGDTSVEDALQFINALNKLTQDEIDDVEALGQAVNYDDAIVNAARDIRGLNEKYSTTEASYGSSIEEEQLNEIPFIDSPIDITLKNPEKDPNPENIEDNALQQAINNAVKVLKQENSDISDSELISTIMKSNTPKNLEGGKFSPKVTNALKGIRDVILKQDYIFNNDKILKSLMGSKGLDPKAIEIIGKYIDGSKSFANKLGKNQTVTAIEKALGKKDTKNQSLFTSSTTPNKKSEAPKAEKPTKKASTGKRGRPAGKVSGMDAEDKEAVKAGEKDPIAKATASTPEEKKEKFNLGLKFIKKYKDDKPKIDAYLKKAKEEYKLTKSMLDDLKRAAGRDVG